MRQVDSDTISIFGLEGDDDRGMFFSRADARFQREAVKVADLEGALRAFLASMGGVLSAVPFALGEFRIDQIELSLEVSAKGAVSLLGSGGEVGGTGGVTLTLTRQEGAGRG